MILFKDITIPTNNEDLRVSFEPTTKYAVMAISTQLIDLQNKAHPRIQERSDSFRIRIYVSCLIKVSET